MAIYLYHVFAGVARWRAVDSQHHLIQGGARFPVEQRGPFHPPTGGSGNNVLLISHCGDRLHHSRTTGPNNC